MGNAALLLFSALILGLALLYFWRKCPDLDIIDIYLVYITLHFGVYPFIRGLSLGKGVVYDTANHNSLVVGMVFLHVMLIVIIIKVIFAYFPREIKQYLSVKLLIEQCARVNNFIIYSIFGVLLLTQIVSYFKYGVKSHMLADDFAKIGKDLPYWLTSVRAIYNYIVLSLFIVLASKLAMSKNRSSYLWIASLMMLIPFAAYWGRKAFVNLIVIGAIILIVRSQDKIFQLKYLKIAALMIISFFIVSNMYLTYRPKLQVLGVSFSSLENPVDAALNFNATLVNLKDRPGTWEFNYLVFDKQLKESRSVTTNGKITLEGFKSAIPRFFWPGKKFQMTSEVIAEEYKADLKDVSLGSNIFGIGQSEFGYFSIVVVPLAIISIMLMTALLLKITFDYPEFFWLISATILNFFIYIEENQSEIFSMLRNITIIMLVFSLFLMARKILKRPNILIESP